MSNVQIPNLTPVISLNGTEQLEAVQSGSSVQITTDQIAVYTQGQYPAPGVISIATSAPITGGTITTNGTIGLAPSGVTNLYLASMARGTVKANVTTSDSAPTDASVSSVLDVIGSGQGSTLYRGASSWAALASGSTGQVLTANGASVAPSWQSLAIAPTDISPTGVIAATYGSASSVARFTVLASGQISAASNVAILIPSSQVSGLGTMAVQNSNSVTITGGVVSGVYINNATIGNSSPSTGAFTTLSASSGLTVIGSTIIGTVTSGSWQGTAVAVAYGGTGATKADDARTNLGAAASGANSDITSLSGLTTALSVPQGGTSFASYTTGDLLYANSASSFARLNDVATGNALISGGVGVAPSWGKIGLTTHVSGTLAVGNGGTGAITLTGYLVGNGTGAFTAVSTIPNAGLTNSSVTIGSTSIALGASSLTLAGLTTVTVTQDPTADLQLATKQYVDNTVSTVANTTYHASVTSATTAALTATYSNGTGGVGATLTNAGAQAAFSIDSYSPTATSRVLVKNQASALQNGIYTVTTVGTILTNWVLTRATDFNTTGAGPDFIETGAAVYISSGTVNGATSWLMNTTGTITVGTTSLNWTQISSAGNIQVDAPIIKTGNTLSLGTVTVANGGTGLTSYTAYGLLYAPTTSSVGNIAPGTVNYPLVSTGVSSAPAYQQLSLTAGVTGILPVANGGTGTSAAFTLGSVVFAGASGNYAQDNAQFFYDDTNNYLGLGTASPNARLTILSPTQTTVPGSLPAGTDLYIVGANGALARMTQDAYGTGFYPAYTGRAARGTAAAPTASQTDDDLSQFTGRGYGASAFGSGSTGIMAFHAAENFTNTAQGTYLSILLAATGATSPTERWRFGPAGQLGIGGATYGTSGYVLTSGGASAAPTWSQISLTTGVTGILPVANGGTGLSSYTVGSIVYASASTTLAGLADVATGNALISGGVGVAPSYGKIGLATHVSGTLPVGSGGTGTTTLTGYVVGNGTSAFTAVASIPNTDITGLGTMSTQDASGVTITGGTINGTTIGATTRSTGAFTTLAANSTSTFTGAQGTFGIGAVQNQAGLNISTASTTATAIAIRMVPDIQSATTTLYRGISVGPTIAAATTLTSYQGVFSGLTSLGAGASATTVTGFFADNSLSTNSGATTVYGYLSNIASASGVWSNYHQGTANNAFAGNTRFGGTAAPTATVDVTGTLAVSSTVSGAGFTSYFASPPAIGSTTASTGAFTTLSASSTVSGAGFTAYFASPPAIGGTAAAAGTFTTLGGTTITASVAFSGPINGTVGATTPSTGSFTTLAASSTVSGTGFSTYLASPPAIGGTAAAAGSFTTLTASTSITVSGVAVPTISSTSTLTNKRVTPRAVTSGTTTGNQTPTGDSSDQYIMTGLTGAITILAPSGTPTDGQKLILRLLDNGTARGITWTTSSGGYRIVGTTLPTTTVANKIIYVGCVYNSNATFWDVVSVAQQA